MTLCPFTVYFFNLNALCSVLGAEKSYLIKLKQPYRLSLFFTLQDSYIHSHNCTRVWLFFFLCGTFGNALAHSETLILWRWPTPSSLRWQNQVPTSLLAQCEEGLNFQWSWQRALVISVEKYWTLCNWIYIRDTQPNKLQCGAAAGWERPLALSLCQVWILKDPGPPAALLQGATKPQCQDWLMH